MLKIFYYSIFIFFFALIAGADAADAPCGGLCSLFRLVKPAEAPPPDVQPAAVQEDVPLVDQSGGNASAAPIDDAAVQTGDANQVSDQEVDSFHPLHRIIHRHPKIRSGKSAPSAPTELDSNKTGSTEQAPPATSAVDLINQAAVLSGKRGGYPSQIPPTESENSVQRADRSEGRPSTHMDHLTAFSKTALAIFQAWDEPVVMPWRDRPQLRKPVRRRALLRPAMTRDGEVLPETLLEGERQ